MQRLRPFGIYLPPKGQRPVFAVPVEGGYYLYDAQHGTSLPPRFEVGPDGSVSDWHGRRTVWTSEELTDTGKTQD